MSLLDTARALKRMWLHGDCMVADCRQPLARKQDYYLELDVVLCERHHAMVNDAVDQQDPKWIALLKYVAENDALDQAEAIAKGRRPRIHKARNFLKTIEEYSKTKTAEVEE